MTLKESLLEVNNQVSNSTRDMLEGRWDEWQSMNEATSTQIPQEQKKWVVESPEKSLATWIDRVEDE